MSQKHKQFIVKVQRPVESNLPPSEYKLLVYNQDHSVDEMFPMDKTVLEIMGDEYKQFWYAHMEGTLLHLDRPAPWQTW